MIYLLGKLFRLRRATRKNRLLTSVVLLLFGGSAWFYRDKFFTRSSTAARAKLFSQQHSEAPATPRKKVGVDKEFLKQLKTLLNIVLPGFRSKECFILLLHTAFLVSRTFVSIYVARLDGSLVKNIVARRGREFLVDLAKWLLLAIPASYINSMIKFLESKLSIAFRTKLTQHLYDLYMANEVYYRVGNLDSRLNNVDQLLTQDTSQFCSSLAHLYSQISKPILDVVLMGGELFLQTRNIAGTPKAVLSTILAVAVIWLTAKVLQGVSPPFGKLIAEQGKHEGLLRYDHARLIANSEEVAFYGGHSVEKTLLEKNYSLLVKHLNLLYWSRIFYNMLEGFFMKYVWGAAGLVMIAVPAFYGKDPGQTSDGLPSNLMEEPQEATTISERTQAYIIARKLLLSAAEAVERIMLALKEVSELAGHTARVYEMIQVFGSVSAKQYQKTLTITSAFKKKNKTSEGQGEEEPVDSAPQEQKLDLLLNGGKEIPNSSIINFSEVPIVSPNGEVLVRSLSFQVNPGEHLLITGPNGCGKSSLFRILGGLWPVHGGLVARPSRTEMFYIPQKPYLSLGSLRDQVIYPHSQKDFLEQFNRLYLRRHKDANPTEMNMNRLNLTPDQQLEEILEWVNLKYLLEREGGWDSIKDWQEILSGGEKQRIAMARLFYHCPSYAILDECTSAVSVDVEGMIYTKATSLGITLLTVSHRSSLWKYHKYLLQFDGEGGWKYSQLDDDTRISLEEEKRKLEAQLEGVPKIQTRLKQLRDLLGANEEAEIQ